MRCRTKTMTAGIVPRSFCARLSILLGLLTLGLSGAHAPEAQTAAMLIDDFSNSELISPQGTRWRTFSDQVMGGVSEGRVARIEVEGRNCLHLSGDVRLENNGGFIQAALDLAPSGGVLDASGFSGVRIQASGNGEVYGLHLRTPDNIRPWQSYRAGFIAGEGLQTIDLPFARFEPYRLEKPLDVRRLRRVGLVAIGRAFQADLSVCEISLYK